MRERARLAARHIRYEVIGLIFIVMTINLADRAAMSIAGTPMSTELHLNHLNWAGFSRRSRGLTHYSSWPAGGRWTGSGPDALITAAVFLWSFCTAGVGFAPLFGQHAASVLIFALIFLIGMAAAPCYPANAKIVSAWFPAAERGTASAIFNATQYFAAAAFTPALALLAANFGWRSVFFAWAPSVSPQARYSHSG